jgi:hypothetical protein
MDVSPPVMTTVIDEYSGRRRVYFQGRALVDRSVGFLSLRAYVARVAFERPG